MANNNKICPFIKLPDGWIHKSEVHGSIIQNAECLKEFCALFSEKKKKCSLCQD